MMKQNYLRISPSSGIASKLNAESLEDEVLLQKFLNDVQEYVKTAEEDNVKFLQSKNPGRISHQDTVKFFRVHERTRNVRIILQYLLSFLSRLPLQENIEGKIVNPFEQLKTFTLYNVNLLKDPDVIAIILEEHARLGLLKESNSWYYRGQIEKNYKQILEVVESAGSISREGYCKLFEALQRLSLFWFSVRNEDIKRVRKSDIYIYRLARLLMKRNGCSDC
ncbi:MAG: hypothetical protein MUF15_06850 [Acidobacteria bacterium]|jgi:hypothetical protein|nr:hypothetical protein [Acidobacteriota bacterium]